jgi:riboflavin kinase / FMN adenylyltransferase
MAGGVVIEDLLNIAPDGGAVLTIGVFDGVHLGHQHLIGQVVRRAASLGCRSGVITFHPHPAAVLRPESALPMLTTLDERLRLIRRLRVDIIATLPFSPELAALSAQDFVNLIQQHLRIRELWVGPDFALGRNREGHIVRLAEIGGRMGFSVHVVPSMQLEGQVVSSTRVRDLLALGDVSQAGVLLGHCFAFSGPVIRGEGRGRSLGFATANLAAGAERALPANGSYAAHVFVSPSRAQGDSLPEAQASGKAEGARALEPLPAVANVGVRPTFAGNRRVVEAHLLDFAGDLYGQVLSVHFVRRLRAEIRFAGASELREQVRQDVVQARRILAGGHDCSVVGPAVL